MGEMVAPGDVLAGKYRVERVLGSGGMGVVVAARHVQLDVLVALKFMAEEILAEKELVGRFLREARAAARLRSEHVARVADVGTLDSGAPYLVMEYLEGTDLSLLLSNAGRQPIANAVEFIVQSCDALDEAHRAGIVHRDVKPSNLFLTTRPNGTPCIKVLDFGISKSERLGSSSIRSHRTRPSALLGSPFYMAPEQMRAPRDVDLRADIWALGATLYELLTGQLPFEAESLLDLALRVAETDPVPPRIIRPEIPWEIEQIVLRCLQKDPDDRFDSASALAAALAPFMPRRDALARAPSRRITLEEPGSESSADAITRVAAAAGFAVADPPIAPPLDRIVSADPSPLNAATTLPMIASVSSVPPVAQSPPRAVRTGARLSWGRSYRLLRKNPRATLNFVFVGLLLSGTIALLAHKSRLGDRSSEATPSDAMPSASFASLPTGIVTTTAEATQPAQVTSQSVASPTHISKLPATDPLTQAPLPSAASPGSAPSVPRPGLVLAPSPATSATRSRSNCEKPFYIDERGATKLRSECQDAASGAPAASTAPAAPPADDFERNPYLR